MARKLTRREFARTGLAAAALAATPWRSARAAGSFRLGLVTYNVARDWDLDTILRLCREAQFEGVEFRTSARARRSSARSHRPREPRCARSAATPASCRRASAASASFTRPTRPWCARTWPTAASGCCWRRTSVHAR